MGGKRVYGRTLGEYTTPVALYRTINGSDASVLAIEETIDLAAESQLGLNTLVLYLNGSITDQVQVYVNPGNGVWYTYAGTRVSAVGGNSPTYQMATPNEVLVLENVPAHQIRVMGTAVVDTLTVHYEFTA